MIISASRRTDIPAFYSDWLLHRLKEGYCYVKNPYHAKRVSIIPLTPDKVDCIVFWTKNAAPILEKLTCITEMGYPFYFQFTITGYDQTVEKGLPPKAQLLDTFKRLSDKIGARRIIWRYDPIFITPKFTVAHHLETYAKMASVLEGYTERSVFSYIDFYPQRGKSAASMGISPLEQTMMHQLAAGFSKIAYAHRMQLFTCAEEIDLSVYKIKHAACIDQALIASILDCSLKVERDKNQRPFCSCIESVDIGSYNSCAHQCTYCYATGSLAAVTREMQNHVITSPLLIGEPDPFAIYFKRKAESLKMMQASLY